jgi:hypothetical protein
MNCKTDEDRGIMETWQNFHTPETNHTHCNIHLLLPQLPITELSCSIRSHETVSKQIFTVTKQVDSIGTLLQCYVKWTTGKILVYVLIVGSSICGVNFRSWPDIALFLTLFNNSVSATDDGE